ncbi:MAG: flavodoxin-dependent (E)-4-hydroxy-3-methylbut-2-enyl-diphosphate synthase [Candidatus Krumholzibacteriota bacterium]|nr:flavodoxin-dependent (E)-4-hydroxy-3-methylbut-2-enyl-diphosphate synthase [Candidatus Krumholzibacteriota bacterium]
MPENGLRSPGIKRRKTRKVFYGGVAVGGGAPVSVQSMCSVPVTSFDPVVEQIGKLARVGCEIVRVAVRDAVDAELLSDLCEVSPIPVVADIHFDHKLAVMAAGTGIAGLRINPGNIGSWQKVGEVLDAAAGASLVVRIGVNAGSLEKKYRSLYVKDPAKALCESALDSARFLEKEGFADAVFSLKSSDPAITVEANGLFAAENDYPLHIGVTEAGPKLTGTARSVVALTQLLISGIGDTVRISLSGDPVDEVVVTYAMLSSLGLRSDVPTIISCPTCGRCHIDVAMIAESLQKAMPGKARGLKVAVMGCEVNGPGEAKEADIGIAGTGKGAVLFRDGKVYKRLETGFLEELLAEIEKIIVEKKKIK